MKKILALLLVLALSLTLVACGSGNTAETKATEAKPAETKATEAPATEAQAAAPDYKVAMVTDYGDITDQSFNQTTWEAVVAFGKDNNVETKYYKPTSNDTAGRVASVELAIAEGYNVIVMPGYAFGGTIVEVAPNYPDVKFVALDVAKGDLLEAAVANKGESYDYNPDNWNLEDYVDMSNVYCAIYQEELPGYMAGYAAVKLGYTKLGFLGGMAVPAVIRYGYGYVQGADAAAKELGITVDMKYAYGNQFSGDADITAVMDTWYADGTEIVFACGGGIYTSAAEAAKKVGGKIIGVDVDQKAIIDGNYGEGMTVTSAMKGLYPTTVDTLTDIVINGKWSDYAGKIETLGLVSGDDPTANYVQLSETTQFGDGFTKDDYAALVKGMFDGTITVSNDTSAEPATTNVNVSWLGNLK
ncbi:MAG TPA: BMP family ABC transporter substrate-binding protein [Clostridiales bacterium]|nr:BMP family ABC transporter substrate-binding protein [Clostridiales bacterium]HCP70775.1 BMP family ABC transporter substrate-binding protein [Clostridiales bacterium]